MPRIKKLHTYTFADGKRDLNAVVEVTCTVTGKAKKFHHSYLAKMIKKKFDNDFSKFEKEYVSNEGKPKVAKEAKEAKRKVKKTKTKGNGSNGSYVPGEINRKPMGYQFYLVTSYKAAERKGDKNKMRSLAEQHLSRYEEPITAQLAQY